MKYFFYGLLNLVMLGLIYLSPPNIQTVFACKSAVSLYLESDTAPGHLYFNHQDPVVINDSVNDISKYVYASAFGNNCTGTPQYAFNIAYWDGDSWRTFDQTGWQTANYETFSLSNGERQYSIGAWTWTSTDGVSPDKYKHLFAMTQTHSVANITHNSAQLSWSLRMNHYNGVSCSPTSLCNSSQPDSSFPFYLLIGTDPAIVSKRSSDPSDVKVEGSWKDYDPSYVRITWFVDNHSVTGLQPNTTYYWRIRGDHPSIGDSYFGGGSFTTLPPPFTFSLSNDGNKQVAEGGGSAASTITATNTSEPGATAKSVSFSASATNLWTQETGTVWPARYAHTSLVFNSKMWVMGGTDGTSAKNDVYSSTDGKNWTQETAAAAWSARYNHTSLVFNGKMWVMGGTNGISNKNDVYSSTDGKNWTQETAAAAWSARFGHTSEFFNNKMWLMGGTDGSGSGYKNDVYSSTDGKNWTQETAAAAWSARYYHTSLTFNNKIWLMGGYDPIGGSKNDVYSSTDGKNWTQETAAAAWSTRYSTSSQLFNGRMWLMGGNGTTAKNDVYSSTDGKNWTQENAAASWGARYSHTSSLFNKKIWLMGGYTPPTKKQAGGPKNDVWSFSDPYQFSFTFSPLSCTPTCTTTMTTTATAQAASTSITVTGTDGTNQKTTSFNLTVGTPPPTPTSAPTSTPTPTPGGPTPTPPPSGPCGSGTPRTEGLISAPSLTGKFNTSSGACVIDLRAAFAPFKLKTFEDLKYAHFDQHSGSKLNIEGSSLPPIANDTAYFKDGNLSITSPISGSGTAAVIVKGDLTIGPISGNQVLYGTPLTGLVFIVSGNIFIDKTVTRVDGVLISSGTIFTASDNTTTPPTACLENSVLTPNGALTINGSLISLTSSSPIKFCRYLLDNASPAEVINHQVKYVVILRNVLSEILQRWIEIP
ncbi:hypothetical protein HYT18_00465 [Candidatus Microgenomates bacterium]|nr:hypothetical protein [Candidatus Microgenomates bacterium]